MLRTLKIALIFWFVSITVFAQMEYKIGAVSDFKIESWYEIRLDSQVLQTLSGIDQPKDIGYQFAIPVPVNLNPGNSGKIYHINNEVVWVVGIRSKEAKSLNLILDPFKVPEGSYIYIYDKAKKVIRGAFSSGNNSSSGILPTMPVPGEEIILEYHAPAGTLPDKTLGISQVSHDYIGIFGPDGAKDNRYKLSEPCNVDINCTQGLAYSVEKQSVCRLMVRGVELCSGVLLNNTNQENKPLLLTAHHCIVDQNDADKTIFVFGYESPWCGGPDGKVAHSLSGSVLKSSNANVDFSLVEMNTFPPITYKPYLSGWNVSGLAPLHTASIHHPMGDVKKISTDQDPPLSGSFTNMPANSAWQIAQWEEGTTQGGSSGAPLYDQNRRVVGILTGGEAVCGRSVNDYFVKLSVLYNYSSLLYEQLKGWIDPAVSGVMQLNGRDPYAPNLLTVDTLTNIGATEKPELTKYTAPGTGYTTGYNADSIMMYAEHFSNSSRREITEILLDIAKTNYISAIDSVRIYLMNDAAVPGSILATQKIFISETRDSFRLKFDFGSPVAVSGNFYIGWRFWYTQKASIETRQFAVYHSPDRVISSANTAWFFGKNGWKTFLQHPFAPMSVSLNVRVVTNTNTAVNSIIRLKQEEKNFLIYPNPAPDKVNISSKLFVEKATLSIVDLSGKVVMIHSLTTKFPGIVTVDLTDINPGFYIFNISSAGSSESHKILINR